MKRNGILMLALIVGCLVLIAGTAFAAGETLSRAAIVAGGGRVSNSAHTLDAAIGQPVAGAVANANNTLCSGLHCSAAAEAATPEPTPDGTTTPEPTPDGTTTPEPTPDGTTTPEPTPDGTTTPEPTPDGTTTPEPTPDAQLFVPSIFR